MFHQPDAHNSWLRDQTLPFLPGMALSSRQLSWTLNEIHDRLWMHGKVIVEHEAGQHGEQWPTCRSEQ